MSFLIKTSLLLLIIFVGFSAKSQEQNKTVLSRDLPGTWIGIYSKNSGNVTERVVAQLMWRIHSIDTLKKQVVMTEMVQHIQDASDIDKPKQKVYYGTYNDSTFVIRFDKQKGNNALTFRFKRNTSEDMKMLMGQADEEAESGMMKKYCTMAKTSDDTSVYVKPKQGEVQVVISPPPTVEHK